MADQRTRRTLIHLMLGASATAAFATEGGGNSYPIGVDNTLSGYMLPEGANWLLFYQHYDAAHNKDAAGNDNAKLANFRLRANVVAPRLSYVWPDLRLFGATLETRVVQPLSVVDLNAGVARPPPLQPLDRGGHDTGLADMSFSPLILGWHGQSLHQTLGIETHLRTGDYDVRNTVNTGRNYTQIAPVYAFTWFPMPAVDLSAKFRWGFNTRNRATDYRSGDEASAEFSAGYRASPQWVFGINGYVYRQTSDDYQHGVRVNTDGNRGRVDALGLHVGYRIHARFALTLRTQTEFGARNRPQGTRIWAMLLCPL
jgi:hypothetical protein